MMLKLSAAVHSSLIVNSMCQLFPQSFDVAKIRLFDRILLLFIFFGLFLFGAVVYFLSSIAEVVLCRNPLICWVNIPSS